MSLMRVRLKLGLVESDFNHEVVSEATAAPLEIWGDAWFYDNFTTHISPRDPDTPQHVGIKQFLRGGIHLCFWSHLYVFRC